MTSVKLGVHLPVGGAGASPQAIARVAEEAERIGLDSVWSWEAADGTDGAHHDRSHPFVWTKPAE